MKKVSESGKRSSKNGALKQGETASVSSRKKPSVKPTEQEVEKALRFAVESDAMSPGIIKGDVVMVESKSAASGELVPGEIVLVRGREGGLWVREFKSASPDGTLTFLASNPAFKPISFRPNKVTVYRAIERRRTLRADKGGVR